MDDYLNHHPINPATVVMTSALTLNPSISGRGTSDPASLLLFWEQGLGDEGGGMQDQIAGLITSSKQGVEEPD
jgi:hypothetical protein